MRKFFIFIFIISFLHGNNFEIKEIISKKQIFEKSLKIESITIKDKTEEGLSPETFLKIDSFTIRDTKEDEILYSKKDFILLNDFKYSKYLKGENFIFE